MNKRINVGLIGFGLGGRVFHAPIITNVDGLYLTKIYTTNKNSIEYIKVQYPKTIVVEELKDIFQDENIELVVIAAKNDKHYSIARQALEADKNVVVEKPFTVTAEEASELIALANKRNKLLTVYQNRRWDSDYKTVKKVIESGMLGKIVEYEAHFDKFRSNIKDSWKEENTEGTGIIYDLGPHLIDQAVDLFGIPEKVTGIMGIQRPNGKVIDNFELIMHYEKTKVTLKAGMMVKEAGPHFIVHGDKGSFIKYGMDVQEEALKKGLTPANSDNWGIEPENLWGCINTTNSGISIRGKVESEVGDYRDFYRNIFNAMNGQEELQVLAQQGRNTIKLIELAIKSSKEGKTILL
jgi:scyllo-inositol 2-dehydrogenase (NADP+)